MRRADGPEEGSTLPLILVFLAIAAGFVIVAAAATAVHLERLRLLTVADGAALAGAESFRLDDVRVEGARVDPVLRTGEVDAAARAYLADAAAAHLAGLHLVAAGAPDGRRASVTIASVWRPPLLSALLPVSVPIQVTSTAAARFR